MPAIGSVVRVGGRGGGRHAAFRLVTFESLRAVRGGVAALLDRGEFPAATRGGATGR
jgi:hypothetical protein